MYLHNNIEEALLEQRLHKEQFIGMAGIVIGVFVATAIVLFITR